MSAQNGPRRVWVCPVARMTPASLEWLNSFPLVWERGEGPCMVGRSKDVLALVVVGDVTPLRAGDK